MRIRKLAAAISATAAAVAMAATGTAVASPDASASGPAAASQPRIAAHALDTAAIRASMAAHHGILTPAEAERLGVEPNTIYVNTPQVRALAAAVHERASQAAPRSGVSPVAMRPDSASGCNDLVCIEVTGSGLEVTKWYTAAYSVDTEDICAYPEFWVDGELDFSGEEICGTLLEAWDDATEYFENNTQLCNTWPGVAGRPCETVHD